MADERLESRRLAQALRSEIRKGATYPPGAKLPSYRDLAVTHSVARNTVGAALRLLEAEGLVEIRRASGAYVRDPDAAPPSDGDIRTDLVELRDQLQGIKREVTAAQKRLSGLLESLPPEERGT